MTTFYPDKASVVSTQADYRVPSSSTTMPFAGTV